MKYTYARREHSISLPDGRRSRHRRVTQSHKRADGPLHHRVSRASRRSAASGFYALTQTRSVPPTVDRGLPRLAPLGQPRGKRGGARSDPRSLGARRPRGLCGSSSRPFAGRRLGAARRRARSTRTHPTRPSKRVRDRRPLLGPALHAVTTRGRRDAARRERAAPPAAEASPRRRTPPSRARRRGGAAAAPTAAPARLRARSD